MTSKLFVFFCTVSLRLFKKKSNLKQKPYFHFVPLFFILTIVVIVVVVVVLFAYQSFLTISFLPKANTQSIVLFDSMVNQLVFSLSSRIFPLSIKSTSCVILSCVCFFFFQYYNSKLCISFGLFLFFYL